MLVAEAGNYFARWIKTQALGPPNDVTYHLCFHLSELLLQAS